MRYRLLCVGKLKQNFLKEACAEYAKRLRPYGELTQIEVPEAKTTTRPSEKERDRRRVRARRELAQAGAVPLGAFAFNIYASDDAVPGIGTTLPRR